MKKMNETDHETAGAMLREASALLVKTAVIMRNRHHRGRRIFSVLMGICSQLDELRSSCDDEYLKVRPGNSGSPYFGHHVRSQHHERSGMM